MKNRMFVLADGSVLIGKLDEGTNSEEYVIRDPMYIMDNSVAMKLRSMTMLSAQSTIYVYRKHVITTLAPSDVMSNYYSKAVDFDKNFTRPDIENQINAAIVSLDQAVLEEEERQKSLTSLMVKLAGQRKPH